MTKIILAGLAVLATTVAAADPSTPSFTIVRGFGGQVYEARVTAAAPPAPAATADPNDICGLVYGASAAAKAPAPDPRASAAPFADGILFRRGGANQSLLCSAAAVAATKMGLKIEFVLGADRVEYKSVTPIDNVDFATDDDVIEIRVCVRPCDGANRTLVYHINPASHVYSAFAAHGDRVVPALSGGIDAIAPDSTIAPIPAPAAPVAGESPVPWFGALTVPWTVLDVPISSDGTSTIELKLSVRRAAAKGATPLPTIAPASTTVTVAVRQAFDGIRLSRSPQSLQFIDDDHRLAALTQYDRYAAPGTTPPPSVALRFVSNPTAAPLIFMLPSPAAAASSPPRFAPLTGDVNAALSKNVSVAGTLSQNGAIVQGIQTAIGAALQGANLPTPAPLPSVPCATCATFQTMNSSSFDLPLGTKRLSLMPKGAGSDDIPFSLGKLPDLTAGGILSYFDGQTGVSLLHAAQATAAPTPFIVTDSAIGLTRQRGQMTFNAVAAYVNHPVAPVPAPSPGATPTPPGLISISHVAAYSFAIADDHVTSNDRARTVSDVTSFARLSYDATDRGFDAFGAVQFKRTQLVGSARDRAPGQDQLTQSILLGYRGADARYQQLDGGQIALPTVSGPVGALDITYAPVGKFALGAEFNASGNSYRSATDRAQSGDVKFTLTKPFGAVKIGVSYETSGGHQTAPLAAAAQLGTSLGDNQFASAVNQLLPSLRSTVFRTRDQVVSVTVTPTAPPNTIASTLSIGSDFDHLAPTCIQLPQATPAPSPLVPTATTVIECSQGASTRTVTGSVGIAYKKLSFFGSFAPTYFERSRSANPSARVYNALLTYQFNTCDGIVVSATNDAEILSLSTLSKINNTLQAELDLQRHFDTLPPEFNAPTLFVGLSNSFGFSGTNYVGSLTAGGPTILVPMVPYPTRAFTFYTGLRFGNRAFRSSLAPDAFCAPVPKERSGFTR